MFANSRSVQLINCRQLSAEYASRLLDVNGDDVMIKELCMSFAIELRDKCSRLEDSECRLIFRRLLNEEIDYRNIEEFRLE